MSGAAIEIVDLRKRFGNVTAIDGLSLVVERGRMFAFVGPDGAGKSTAMRALCGIVRPDSGRISVLGLDARKDGKEIKRRIGYLSQRFSLYGDLTVDENVEFFAEINGVRDFGERRDELLEFTRLAPFRKRLAARLSGGMKQKLALACTLIHRPEILFLDEPTTGVDPVSRREFWSILSGLLADGMTIVMATPYMDEAERCASVGLIHHGRFLIAGTPSAVKAALPADILELDCDDPRAARGLLREAPGISDIQVFGDHLDLLVEDKTAAETLIRTRLGAAGMDVAGLRSKSPSLENVFISLIGGAA
ncbi:MAG: multidrug ABC transporter ATP-binding protein [Spirochaetae bacterium HGW-Spirochaetae-3]|jgi:ABC-2 type transport system ATP-binding protein|nr:MAG: multidrug ABC transporter ATP-binding protein [Spirochaetae bacterium HGW-Spirochaetae-3]